MKWGTPVAGSGATVTYAVVDSERRPSPAPATARSSIRSTACLRRATITRATFDRELDAAFAAWSSVADIRFRNVEPARCRYPDRRGGDARRARLHQRRIRDPGRSTERASLTRSVICLNPDATVEGRLRRQPRRLRHPLCADPRDRPRHRPRPPGTDRRADGLPLPRAVPRATARRYRRGDLPLRAEPDACRHAPASSARSTYDRAQYRCVRPRRRPR